METTTVLFYTVSLKHPISALESVYQDHPILNQAVIEYSKELEKSNIETFKIDRNVIVTEDGYKVAIFDNQANIEKASTN